MGLLVLVAIVLGMFGLLGLFLFPWVGGPMLVVAVIIGVIGVVVGAPAAATAVADEDVGLNTEDSPHLPGPGNAESGVN
jgi:hypothetical protein